MTETAEPKPKHIWLLGTPLMPLALAITLVVLFIPTMGMTDAEWVPLHYEFAVVPARFFAEPGSQFAYPNILAQIFSLFTVALLHADWLHVGVNALMTWQFGSIVQRIIGPGITNAGKWTLLFLASIGAGSLAFLFIAGPSASMVVGASGGTSGLVAASFLIDYEGRVTSPLTRSFAINTVIFVLINAALVYLGQYAGLLISWEAHMGGYLAGMAMMLILGRKIRAAPAA